MEEQGMIVGRDKVEELAEARALELLQAIKAQHGIPACGSAPEAREVEL